MKKLTLIPVAALALLGMQAQAATTTIKIPKAAVVSAFNTALQSTQVRLDNYGKRQGSSWLATQSYVLLPNGKKVVFKIPESVIKINKRRQWKHYVDDMRSQSIQASAPGSALVFDIRFESQGREIKGKCLRKGKPCKLKMNRDIELNNANLRVSAVPTALDGSISYRSPKVKFAADLSIPNKLCKTFKKLCGKIENAIYKKAGPAVESRIRKALDRADIRKAVAKRVRQLLGGQIANMLKGKLGGYVPKQWSITKVAVSGNAYVLTIKHPDVINGNSVKIKAFKVKKPKASMTCPGNIDFSATIVTTGKVKGNVWLEYVSPKAGKGATLKWQMPKAGAATSTLTQKGWKSTLNMWRSGSTRLVVTWKGTNGKTYTIKSKPVKFSRRCQLPIKNKTLQIKPKI